MTAIKQLKNDTTIKILPADKGNATVIMDVKDYNLKLESVITEDKYTLLKKNPTKSLETKVYKTLVKYKTEFNDRMRSQLTPHYSKPPHIYGLPKIHKPTIPVRPIVSSIGSPCYNLAKYLVPIISPLTGTTSSFVKNSAHFVDLIKNETITKEDLMVSFDVESLFTNVPVDEALNIIRNRLEKMPSLSDHTHHSIDCIMELLTICVKTTYFQKGTEFYQQKEGMPMGSPLSPIISNIYMEFFEELALETAKLQPSMWLRYVDDTFVVWPHGRDELDTFHKHLNSIRQTIKFTFEIEENKCIPFLDVLVKKGGP